MKIKIGGQKRGPGQPLVQRDPGMQINFQQVITKAKDLMNRASTAIQVLEQTIFSQEQVRTKQSNQSGMSVPHEQRSIEQIRAILDKQQSRMNWNFFVGQTRFQTDWILSFKQMTTARLYQTWTVSSSLYSIRLWLLMLYIVMLSTEARLKASSLDSFNQMQRNLNCHAFPESAHEYTTCQEGILVLQRLNEEQSVLSWLVYNQLGKFLMFGVGMQATIERSWTLLSRQMLMSLTTMHATYSLIQMQHETSAFVPDYSLLIAAFKLSLFAPCSITGLLVYENWKKFAAITSGIILICSLFYEVRLAMEIDVAHPAMPPFSTWQLFLNSLPILTGLTFVFAVFEKINKERFVINQTNQQSRKLLSELINQCCAAVTVTPEGKITFFNEAFNALVCGKLLYEALPENIFGLFSESKAESEQLQNMLHEVYSQDQSKVRDPANPQKRRIIEIRVPRRKQPQKLLIEQDENGEDKEPEEPIEESKKEKKDLKKGKCDIDLYQMVRISCHLSQYGASKCLILSIESIIDFQSHAQLIVQQAHVLQDFLSSFSESVEHKMLQDSALPVGIIQSESRHNSESFKYLAQSVGNPHILLFCIQQIHFQVKLMSIMSVAQTLWNGHRTCSDFLMGPKLIQCIDQCSNLLSNHAEVILTQDDVLPEVINGDMDILMLVLQTLTEFSLRYCTSDEKININTAFDSMAEDGEVYMVSYQWSMPVNPKFNQETIFQFLNVNDPFGCGNGADEINGFFLQRQISYKEYLEEFGIGLLILPCLVNLLEGKINASFQTEKKKRGGTSKASSSVISGLGGMSANDVAEQPQQIVMINLHVPLNPAEKSNVLDHKKPVLMTNKLSNRKPQNQGEIQWLSPKFLRYSRELFKRNSNSVMTEYNGFGNHRNNSSSLDVMKNGLAEAKHMPHVCQTPQVNHLRKLSSDMFQQEHLQDIGAFQSQEYGAKSAFDQPNRQPNNLMRYVEPKKEESPEVGVYNLSQENSSLKSPDLKESSGGAIQRNRAISMANIPAPTEDKKIFCDDVGLKNSIVEKKDPAQSLVISHESNDSEFQLRNDGDNKDQNDGNALKQQDRKSPLQISISFGLKESDAPNPCIVQPPPLPMPREQPNRSNVPDMESPVAKLKLNPRSNFSGSIKAILGRSPEPSSPEVAVPLQQIQEPAIVIVQNDQQIEQQQLQEQPIIIKLEAENNAASQLLSSKGVELGLAPEDGQQPVIKLPLAIISEQAEPSYSDDNQSMLGENIPQEFMDEMVPNSDMQHINVKAIQNPDQGDGSNWKEEDFEDDDEPVFTEQQKAQLDARKERLMQDYHAKLLQMRRQEIARRQEIIQKKAADDQQSFGGDENEEDLPIVMIREDDYIGESNIAGKLVVHGATDSLLHRANADREHLRQNNPPMNSPRGHQNRKVRLEDRKLDKKKFENDQKFREVQRRIYEQIAINQTHKHAHELIKPQLVEIQELPVMVEEQKVEIQPEPQVEPPQSTFIITTGQNSHTFAPQSNSDESPAQVTSPPLTILKVELGERQFSMPEIDNREMLNNSIDSVSQSNSPVSPQKRGRIVHEGIQSADLYKLMLIKNLDLDQCKDLPENYITILRDAQNVLKKYGSLNPSASASQFNIQVLGAGNSCSSRISASDKHLASMNSMGSQSFFSNSNADDSESPSVSDSVSNQESERINKVSSVSIQVASVAEIKNKSNEHEDKIQRILEEKAKNYSEKVIPIQEEEASLSMSFKSVSDEGIVVKQGSKMKHNQHSSMKNLPQIVEQIDCSNASNIETVRSQQNLEKGAQNRSDNVNMIEEKNKESSSVSDSSIAFDSSFKKGPESSSISNQQSLRVKSLDEFSQKASPHKKNSKNSLLYNQSIGSQRNNSEPRLREDKRSSGDTLNKPSTIKKVKIVKLPVRMLQNRGLFHDRCQKCPGVDSFFAQQQLLKQDIEDSKEQKVWGVKERKVRRAVNRAERPRKPEEKHDPDEDDEEEQEQEQEDKKQRSDSSSSSINEIFRAN